MNDNQLIAQLAAEFTAWFIWRPQHPDGTPSCWAATPHGAGTLATIYAPTTERLRELLAGDQTVRVIYAQLAEDFPDWHICFGPLGWTAATVRERQVFVTYADHGLELRARLTTGGPLSIDKGTRRDPRAPFPELPDSGSAS